ncbi:MAG: cytochrome C [Cupriavidus sp.]|nr:MAG: cytochrome C [Cupriavidus sp.]
MKSRQFRIAVSTLLLCSGVVLTAGCSKTPATSDAPAKSETVPAAAVVEAAAADISVVDNAGNLRVPKDYQMTYQALGPWAVAADTGKGSKEVHNVYASPGAIEAYRKSKRFPDGTVLVKEVYDTSTGEMTTGTVSRPDKLKGWFVMVKDSKNSHPGNPLWGDGWGWSWFDAGNPNKTTSTDYKTDCQACHTPAQATDWIYVDGYPVLKN